MKEADDKIDYILGGGYSSAKRPDLAAEHRVLRHSPVDLWHAQVGAAHYDGDRYTKKLFCWEQFLAMAFTQLVSRESLRDIEACLGAIGPKLYHMGLGSAVARSTLADANENRDWRIFADFAQVETREGLLPVRPLCQVPCLRPDLRRQHRPRPTRVAGNCKRFGVGWAQPRICPESNGNGA